MANSPSSSPAGYISNAFNCICTLYASLVDILADFDVLKILRYVGYFLWYSSTAFSIPPLRLYRFHQLLYCIIVWAIIRCPESWLAAIIRPLKACYHFLRDLLVRNLARGVANVLFWLIPYTPPQIIRRVEKFHWKYERGYHWQYVECWKKIQHVHFAVRMDFYGRTWY